MCIICHAAKKRHIAREEVLESMRVNPAGFFMCALKPDGKRETIRTLDEKEAIRFFDESVKDEDEFVMHARIPSRGEKTLDNVHGWESDGILFMHNMTITEVDSMMRRVKWDKTDSEFFFRKIFIPYYRGLKDEAYKDGKFHEDLDNIIQHFVGTSNKFCFIMPDNKVIRYGTWVSEPTRKENGEIAFYASNSGYRVYNRSWKGGTAANPAGFCGNDLCGYGDDIDDYGEFNDYSEYYGYGCDYYGYGKKSRRKKKEKKDFDGKVLLKLAGINGLCQIALAHLVVDNAITCRAIYSEKEEEEKEIAPMLRAMLPVCFSEKNLGDMKTAMADMLETYDKAILGDKNVEDAVDESVEEFCDKLSAIYEHDIVREYSNYAIIASEYNVKAALEMVVPKVNAVLRILNVHVDFKSLEPNFFTTGFVLSKDGWSMEEYMMEDLLCVDEIPADDSSEAIEIILAAINNDTSFIEGKRPVVKESAEDDPGNPLLSDDAPAGEQPATEQPAAEETAAAEPAEPVEPVKTEEAEIEIETNVETVKKPGDGDAEPDEKDAGPGAAA